MGPGTWSAWTEGQGGRDRRKGTVRAACGSRSKARKLTKTGIPGGPRQHVPAPP